MPGLVVRPGQPEDGHILERSFGILPQKTRHILNSGLVVFLLIGIEPGNKDLGIFGIKRKGGRWERERNEKQYSQCFRQ